MSDPFVGEIRLFSFTRAPNGWYACDGSLKSVAENQVLFVLLGTTYGGDGRTTFGVPDMRGQVPIHQGTGPGLTPRVLAQTGGSETVTLLTANMPAHSHPYSVTNTVANTAVLGSAGQQLGAAITNQTMYGSTIPAGITPFEMATGVNTTTGNNQPHDNTMPTLNVSFCIAYAGIYPSQQ